MIGRIAAIALYLIMVYFDIWSLIIPDNHIFVTLALWILFCGDGGWPLSYTYNKTISVQKAKQKEDESQ